MTSNAYMFLRLNGDAVVGETLIASIGGIDVSGALELHECSFGVHLADAAVLVHRRGEAGARPP